jgi:Alpha-L-arabinofuranosidase B (ABFB) domain
MAPLAVPELLPRRLKNLWPVLTLLLAACGAGDEPAAAPQATGPAAAQIVAQIVVAGATEKTIQAVPTAMAARDTQPDTWVATDGLGRVLPRNKAVGDPRPGKFVGIFYHLWEPGEAVFDITKILSGKAAWGPRWSFHWWSEPYLGYYYRDDEYVIRRHAQMLADAGVDVLFIDASNGLVPTRGDFNRLLKLCEVYTRMRAEGVKTPQISFLTGDDAKLSADSTHFLYDNFYKPGQYADLWFRWQGKPIMLANTQNVSAEAKGFFTVRRSWAWSNKNGWFGDGRDRWPWLDNHPQRAGWHESPSVPEGISVGTAQHPQPNIGRSFHGGSEPAAPTPNAGLNFAEQWARALEVDPQFILITGWNEWIAQRFIKGQDPYTGPMAGKPLANGDSYFVDAYSQEYSRDIEPMRGGHGDAYYYQMVDGIRRFKGVRAVASPTPAKTIEINADFSQWRSVGPYYIDDIGDTAHRSRPGSAARSYVNNSGRNDLAVMQVARDTNQLYFYARTTRPMTAPANHWMTLYLNTDHDGTTGWNGFDYAVNRVNRSASAGVLERYVGGQWQAVADVTFVVANNELHFALPRETLGLGTARGPLSFDFKWADNGPTGGDAIAFLDHGDTAPNGRFAYRFEEGSVTAPTGSSPTGGLLPLDRYGSLQVTTPGLTDRFVRHQNELARTDAVAGTSAALLKADATFKVTRGLADGRCHSFESRNHAGHFLRHRNFRLRIDASDNSDLFKADATFCAHTGLAGTGVSLESKNLPGSYIRHINSEVWLAKSGASNAWDTAANFNQDASWSLAAPWAP